MSFEWKFVIVFGKFPDEIIIVIDYLWFPHVLFVDDNSLDLYKVIDKDVFLQKKIYINI